MWGSWPTTLPTRPDCMGWFCLSVIGFPQRCLRAPVQSRRGYSLRGEERGGRMSTPWGERAAAEGYDFEPDDEEAECEICGCYLDYDDCSQCGGEGGHYPYEDCPFEYAPEEWEVCESCKGSGIVEWCPNAAYHPRLIA